MQRNSTNQKAFEKLFRDACKKCFGYLPSAALSESDCRMLASAIENRTGLVIGAKSLRNYSLDIASGGKRKENPSEASLDTLARYVLDAPYMTESERKEYENHFPYWFNYRRAFASDFAQTARRTHILRRPIQIALGVAVIVIAYIFIPQYFLRTGKTNNFSEDFSEVSYAALSQNKWSVRSIDPLWWDRRTDTPGHLTLYTLRGDNWQGISDTLPMRNIVYRRIPDDCFTTTIDLTNFVPMENWQQAGLLLSEDSTFKGKVIRISLAYNNFFGGYPVPPEILIQGIVSTEKDLNTKPEEFLHLPIFELDKKQEQLVRTNLAKFALKVEKRGDEFRFLYAAGPMKDFAFKAAITTKFNIRPRYIGIFAAQGGSKTQNPIPARFDSFSFNTIPCRQ